MTARDEPDSPHRDAQRSKADSRERERAGDPDAGRVDGAEGDPRISRSAFEAALKRLRGDERSDTRGRR